MVLTTEKEFRQAVQVAVAAVLLFYGFPIIALVLVLLILPWQPIYRAAAYFGGAVLETKARRTVKLAMKKLREEHLHIN